jgi:hypothetical protein
MDLLKNIFKFIVLIIYAIFNFIFMIIETLTKVRNYFDLFFGIIYQPVVFLVSLLILIYPLNQLETLYTKTGNVPVLYIIMILVGFFIIVISLNALIELIYYLLKKEEHFNVIFDIQKVFYNYSLIVISLIALWVAYEKPESSEVNLKLLIFGICFFLCVIISDIYNYLIHSKNKVKELYKDIMQKKEELFWK